MVSLVSGGESVEDGSVSTRTGIIGDADESIASPGDLADGDRPQPPGEVSRIGVHEQGRRRTRRNGDICFGRSRLDLRLRAGDVSD